MQLPLKFARCEHMRVARVRNGEYAKLDKMPYKDWLVELRSIQFPEVVHVEIVAARDELEAAQQGFFTRNIADSWEITEISEGA